MALWFWNFSTKAWFIVFKQSKKPVTLIANVCQFYCDSTTAPLKG